MAKQKEKKKKPKLTVAEAWEHYYAMSGAASNSARQLAFAGIAVVWILATDNNVVPVENANLRLPIFAFVLALAFDLIQYVVGTGMYWQFAREKERKNKEKFEEFPRKLNIPSEIIFIGKVAAVIWGYGLLFRILGPVLLNQPSTPMAPP